MDLVNDLSSEVALAVLVEGSLKQKLALRDAKSFIAALEAELIRISKKDAGREFGRSPAADLSH